MGQPTAKAAAEAVRNACLQAALDGLGEARVEQAARRHVDRHRDRETGLAPLVRGGQRLIEHGVGERPELPGPFNGVEEPVRGQVAAVRVVPAGERLGRDRLAGTKVDDRLEVDRELVLGDRAGQVAAERERADVGGVAGVCVDDDPLAVAFGLVHRDVGAAQ